MVKLTREYMGGTLAGLGLGVVTGAYLSSPIGLGLGGWHPAIVIPGFAMLALGATLARSTQRRDATPRPSEK